MEERCKDCSDAQPCMRMLCEWCFHTHPLGELVSIKVKPKVAMTSDEAIDWVRGLNPNRYRKARANLIHPRLCHAVHPTTRGIRCTHIEGHSGSHYDILERAKWEPSEVRTTPAKMVYSPVALAGGEHHLRAHSPNCADAKHSHCVADWCKCVCHDVRIGPDPTKES